MNFEMNSSTNSDLKLDKVVCILTSFGNFVYSLQRLFTFLQMQQQLHWFDYK